MMDGVNTKRTVPAVFKRTVPAVFKRTVPAVCPERWDETVPEICCILNNTDIFDGDSN